MKIIVTQGIPCSGKSTWAREYVNAHEDTTVIVNRDSIRSMLGEYWVPSREPLVTVIERSMIEASLKEDYDVIIDATNLNDNVIAEWKRIAKKFGADIEFKLFLIDVETAIARDYTRGEAGGISVGEAVITGFYKRYKDKLENEV